MLRHKLVTPVLMWSIVILGSLLLVWALPDRYLLPGLPLALLLAAAIWAVLLWASFVQHRDAPRSAADIPRIIKTGPYRYIRHPMYAADILLAVGLIIGYPRIDILITALFAIVVFLLWMRLEERALRERFGEAYRSYAERTPMLFPRVR